MTCRRHLFITGFGIAILGFTAWVDAAGLDDLFRVRDARSRRVSSADPNWKDGNADCRGIEPGGTLTVAEIDGPGIIRHIWFTISAADPKYGRSLTLRMYWDGSDEPAVESPIGDFFAVGHGALKYVNSMPVAVTSDGRAQNCYWPMPFAKKARITITNDSREHKVHCVYSYVDYEEVQRLPEDTAYFHAQYRQEYPAKMGQNYLILDTEGRGHYVGTVLSVQLRTQSWFGEGDDYFYIDGEEEPSLRGTGTEDYFCDAWGFRQIDRPFYGLPLFEGYEIGDRLSVYRWHIPDPVHFKKSLKVTIEHKGVTFDESGKLISGFMERPDLFSSVAFWYQMGKAKRFATVPPLEERVVPSHRIELESVQGEMKPTPADTKLELQDGAYSAGRQILAQFRDPKGRLVVPFQVKSDVEGMAALKLTKSFDYGIWKVSLDGKVLPNLQAIDLYSATIVPSDFKLGHLTLAAGAHELTFECVGRNEASGGTFLGVDALQVEQLTPYLLPVKEEKKD